MAHGFNTWFLFLALMALAVASCANNDNEVRAKNLRTVLDYSSAVQKQSVRWGELNKIWDQLAEEADPKEFQTVLSLHGIKKLRDYIDGIDRITTTIPDLSKAHKELVSRYRSLEEDLLAFLGDTEVNFREKPEQARGIARKELARIFTRTRLQESRYLESVREVYKTYGIRLESNTSNRYVNPDEGLKNESPEKQEGE